MITVIPVTRWAVGGLTSRAPGIGDGHNNCKYGHQPRPLIGQWPANTGLWLVSSQDVSDGKSGRNTTQLSSVNSDTRDTFQPEQMGSNYPKYLPM